MSTVDIRIMASPKRKGILTALFLLRKVLKTPLFA